MLRTLSAVAVIAMILLSTNVSADRAWPVGNDSIHLYYNDLDTRTAAGRAALLARVERAAAKLCRDREYGCAAATVRDTAALADAGAVKLALAERGAVQLAGR